jgi:uncharacterized Zn-finger protein
MDTVNDCEYRCVECSKEYKAYKSLWEHNRVHHGGKKVEKVENVIECEYKCVECSKEYTSYKSLWEHNRVHHDGKKVEKLLKDMTVCGVIVAKNYPCRKCPLIYKHRQTRYAHEKNCVVSVDSREDIEVDIEVNVHYIEVKQKLIELDIKIKNLNVEQNNLNAETRDLELKIKLTNECIARFREEESRDKQKRKDEGKEIQTRLRRLLLEKNQARVQMFK